MNVLKPFLNPKKLRKLQNNPQAFFKDALDKRIIPIQNQLKSLKPKKKHAFAEYYIISAVYNVEKYLEDYFNSILKQRLDFKNNIKIICVDDGSTDDSAKIIKQYQSKYPNNIFYLHKENGGQASARNLGLQWLQERLGYAVETEAMRHCEQSEAIHNPANQNTNHFVIARATPEAIHNAESRNEDSIVEAKGEISDNGLPQPLTRLRNDAVESVDCHESQAILAMTQSKSHKPVWVTFTDPDDFLDRDYFYEVDKFLEENTDKDIALIKTRVMKYDNNSASYKKHILDDVNFQNKTSILKLCDLDTQLPSGNTSLFLAHLLFINKIQFPEDEEARANFEDVRFTYEYQSCLENKKIAMLHTSYYYLRIRSGSTTSLSVKKKEYYLGMPRQLIDLCKLSYAKFGRIGIYEQNLCLYHHFWYFQKVIFDSNLLQILTTSEKDKFLSLVDKSLSYISLKAIMDFNLMPKHFTFFHRVGILNCFKKEYPPFQITYIEAFDAVKRQILIRYFTPDAKDIESFRIDGEEVYADVEKIVQNDFLDRVFCYEKRLWVHIPQNSNELEIFVRGQRARITFGGKQHQSLKIKSIDDRFQQLLNPNTLWLLMDRDTEADDNAEHFYRYIAKNYPKQNIVFALRRESKDWTRLQKEGFNLVAFDTQEFRDILKNSSKVISSHIDAYLVQHLGKDTLGGKDFVFLQHGVIKDDMSSWLNSKQLSLFITSTQDEYNSIAGDFNHYIFGNKEVQLTGLARHDRLLSKSLSYQKQTTARKQILIMPTWRKYLVGDIIGNSNRRQYNPLFIKSLYFQTYLSLLQSKTLKNLCEKHQCRIIFFPHQNTLPYLRDFRIPDFISLGNCDRGLQAVFVESDIMITDYSSVAFEMAYLKKPVLYYQFDEEEFRSNQWQSGYFDYRKDGFGPVVTTEEDLLQELEILLKNDCKVGEPYKSNIENTFEFRDGKCCERIYQAILELDKPYERKWTLDYVLNLAQNALNAECYKEASERFRFVLEHLGDNERVGLNRLVIARRSPPFVIARATSETIHNPANQNTNNGIAKNNGEISDNGLPRDSNESLAMTKSYQMRHCEQSEAIHNPANQNTNHFVIARATSEAIHNQTYLKDSIAESRVDKINDELNEEIIFNYLYASRLNQTSQEALEFLKAQDYENKLAFSNKVKFEIIKNYIEILDAQEVITRLEDLKEAIPQTELLEFAYLKLRIYAYLGDKAKLKEVYNELKNTYNIDKKDLDLDLFLFQNELIKAASLQTATASAGGGGISMNYMNSPTSLIFNKFSGGGGDFPAL